MINKQYNLFIIVYIIFLYHFYIQNKIEKKFFYKKLNYKLIKRPLKKCNNYTKLSNCFGMPSGSTEGATIISILLYNYNIISYYFCLFIIFIISLQRIFTNHHTIIQVLLGVLFGLFYSKIYIFYNLSFKSFFIILFIGFIFYFT